MMAKLNLILFQSSKFTGPFLPPLSQSTRLSLSLPISTVHGGKFLSRRRGLQQQRSFSPISFTACDFSPVIQKMEMDDRESSAVPYSVTDSVKRSLAHVEDVRTHFLDFLSLSDPDVLAQMPPLQRAQSLLLLAKATTTLFTLKLRCNGVDPDEHPVKSELERLSLYQNKLERFIGLSNAPLRPSTTLNFQAATRFIQHSLPDLTPEQRKSMRAVGKEKKAQLNKRKYESTEKKSVKTAAKEFLEKAALELLGGGDNEGRLKGPLQFEEASEDEENS
ncbi:uncharacterized protein LOC133801410 [Humulus lupulus]|uniref:uncharacterized protein LOC133801410 n=1 Tax=Humulus lupulus TaxID=3486 RepID=UPI002B416D69|nr:uncharacterized protein LOC133801410 [Humulus lupulus]XP_062095597.1 uncharacterized protein LOC133801410 [Humulus lupulus]